MYIFSHELLQFTVVATSRETAYTQKILIQQRTIVVECSARCTVVFGMKQIQIDFGNKLKFLRERAGISQAQLGEEAGLDRTFISLMERGDRQPSLTTLVKLSNALKVSITKMIFQFGYQRDKKS
jgi:DNA-binding XRE family transcriptional regulator